MPARPNTMSRARLRELALVSHRYGYRRLTILLRREGVDVARSLMGLLYGEVAFEQFRYPQGFVCLDTSSGP
jgi:hypothetical protein